MRHALAALMIGAVVVVAGHIPGAEAAPQSGTTGKAAVPPPIAVEVVAIDPAAGTITVRDIAAVPATPGKKVEVKLPVAATATGQKLGDTKAGETVAVTCEIKPTVLPKAGVPLVLTDCVRVIRIQPKS